MINLVHRLECFVGLALLQVLILNQMHILGYATPFFYIYFILKFNSRAGRNGLMLWAFALGLAIDMLGNTPGMNAAAATFLAFSRNSILNLITLRDEDEGFSPGIKTLGISSFFRYALLTCGLFSTVFLLIDTFSFFDVGNLLLKILTSTVSTVVCVMCAEFVGGKKG